MFAKPPKIIHYCYGVDQPLYTEMKENITGIEFHEGLPARDDLEAWNIREPGHKILILDDIMQKCSKSVDIVDVYCQFSHHWNYTCWLICQNCFSASPQFRTLSLNTHYIFLFKNHRDQLQVQTLGRQMFPGQTKYFMDAYRKATEKKYKYLLVDLSPHSDPEYKLRTDILPGQLTIVFLPENK
ncbi:MAG: hypothetical protein ABW185_11050 [Sedimenticola sp.]